MNPFESDLRAARAAQRRLYLSGLVVLVLALAGLAGGLLYANGTGVTILPADAAAEGSVTVVDGAALVLGGIVFGVAETPRIAIAAPGFRTLERRLTAAERGRRVAVELEPLPGRILATTEPAYDETRWSIDGIAVATGAALDGTVAAGQHALRAEHPWHPLVEESVVVGRGATVERTLVLPPLAGQLAIASLPEGAAVTINEAAAGVTPLVHEGAGGPYAITVAADGYEPVNETIELTRDAPEATRNYRLKPAAALLTVTVEPGGGELLLDGRRIEPGQAQEVASGRDHRVSYLRPGWKGTSETVQLAPGEARTLALSLARDLGTVEIHAAPDAEIYVDGTRAGTGRATLSLSAVPHRIELRKPGYRTIAKTVTPSGTRTIVLRETLQTELAARVAAAPRVYRNSAGIEMVLFTPSGSFTMGAPRGEKGQRANEFLRNVTLAKRFYASRHEVTNAQYSEFRAGAGNGVASAPVTGVSWIAAAEFCNWLSAREKLVPFYRIAAGRLAGFEPTADGYRMLSEAEWEWLARRAGKPAQTIFTWGDMDVVPKAAGNIADETARGLTRDYVPNYIDGHAQLAPVGSYPAEPSGLFDMTGNVNEWVHDYYDLVPPRAGARYTDPLGPANGDTHVVKGSSWRSGTRTTLRASFRDGLAASRDDVGFRIGRYLYGAEQTQ
jgi:formylglycine-generating enzyme required for sulfatase activity